MLIAQADMETDFTSLQSSTKDPVDAPEDETRRAKDQKAIQIWGMYMLLKNNLNRDAKYLLVLNDNLLSERSLISNFKVMASSSLRSKNWIE